MAFEHNDIVNKTRLMGELGEELMGFEHNDIVTVDVMNKAIAEGGGGGGGDYTTAKLTVISGTDELTNIDIYVPCIINGDLAVGAFLSDLSLDSGQSIDIDVVLYNGKSGEIFPSGLAEFSNLTGNISSTGSEYVMTGDASITYTPLE